MLDKIKIGQAKAAFRRRHEMYVIRVIHFHLMLELERVAAF